MYSVPRTGSLKSQIGWLIPYIWRFKKKKEGTSYNLLHTDLWGQVVDHLLRLQNYIQIRKLKTSSLVAVILISIRVISQYLKTQFHSTPGISHVQIKLSARFSLKIIMWLAYTRNLGNSQDKRDMDCYFKFSVVMKIKMYTNEKKSTITTGIQRKEKWLVHEKQGVKKCSPLSWQTTRLSAPSSYFHT